MPISGSCNASLMPMTLREQGTQRITRWCKENRLVHAVGRIYPLEDIKSAHEAVEAGSVIGNVLVAM
jgi:NADPH:quinone reductase-like Zn-dependent oxidoreductase